MSLTLQLMNSTRVCEIKGTKRARMWVNCKGSQFSVFNLQFVCYWHVRCNNIDSSKWHGFYLLFYHLHFQDEHQIAHHRRHFFLSPFLSLSLFFLLWHILQSWFYLKFKNNFSILFIFVWKIEIMIKQFEKKKRIWNRIPVWKMYTNF